MNLFKIGDKIIYPNQGIGVIEDIKQENYFGESFNLYHVRIISNNTLVLIPSSNTEEIGIRKPVSEDNIEKVFNFMRSGLVDVAMNWKGRYKGYLELMRSGHILDIALVLKSLYYLSLIKPLSFREKKMMEKAKDLVVSEISEVSCIPCSNIEKRVFDSLSLCFENVPSQVDT